MTLNLVPTRYTHVKYKGPQVLPIKRYGQCKSFLRTNKRTHEQTDQRTNRKTDEKKKKKNKQKQKTKKKKKLYVPDLSMWGHKKEKML